MRTRRDVLIGGLAGSAALGLGLSCGRARAQTLSRLDILVPSGPGGGWDQTGRVIEFVLRSEGLIDEFRFEHALGGGGAVGLARFLASKRGQGDALMVSGMVMVGALAANNSPVKLTDTTPIARLTGEFEVIAVHKDSPLQTMGELIAMFRADPGSVSWAGGSAGGTDHILAGMIAKAVGVDFGNLAYIAYAGGGRAQAALLGNQVTCGINGYAEFSEQIAAGNLRALAISSAVRQPGIDVPTLKEQGIDVELSNWRGVFGAPGLDDAQKNALADLMGAMVATPTWQSELAKRNWTDIFLPGEPFAQYLRDEITRVTAILKEVGLAR